MLYFITGGSGSGKTEYIRNLMFDLVSKKSEKVMLIVPEQSSFENEVAMIKLMGPKFANKIKVMSFTRLCDLVFRKTGGVAGKRLDDSGRSILMSIAIEEVNDKLSVYKKPSNRVEMVDLMLKAFKEYKMCAVTPDMLIKQANDIHDNILKSKVKESALIMQAYDSLIEQSYLDPLDDLTRLYNALLEYDFFHEYTVFFDSFYSFSMQELKVLELIMRQANNLYISFTIENYGNINSNMELFFPVKKTMSDIMYIANENNIKIVSPINLFDLKRFKSDDLNFLISGIYRNEKLFYNQEPKNVFLYNAENLYDEVDFVARTICKCVAEENYRYKDFAVITRDIDVYKGIIGVILKKYDIPFFIDKRESVENTPLIKLVKAAFNVIHSNFSSAEIFQYLKTGLTNLTVEEISILENYVLMWGIDKKEWFENFTFSITGIDNKNNSLECNKRLETVNEIRCRAIEPLIRFSERINDKTGDEIAKGVYLLLEDLNIPNLIGNSDNIDEEIRIWEILINILDQTALTLKGNYISSKRYAEVMNFAIIYTDIAFIPQSLDEVIVCSADRSILAEPKITFAIGCTQGDFPRTPTSTGIFSDSERKKLNSLGLSMYSALEDLAVEERFLAYKAIASPSERIYISFSNLDSKNNVKYPSSIIKEVIRLFPNIKIGNQTSEKVIDFIWKEKPTFDLSAKIWNEDSTFSETLKTYFKSKENFKKYICSINNSKKCDCIKFNDPKNALDFFGNDIKVSASQVDKYYLCKFQYFCMYGLNLKDRKKISFDSIQYGSVMHYLLENIFKNYDIDYLSSISDEKIRYKINNLLREYIKDKFGEWKSKSKRFEFQFLRIVSTSHVIIKHILKELSQSKFKPVDFELSIKNNGDVKPLELMLPDGGHVLVEGKIDRVDIMKHSNINYVRVIDYKTGTKDFKLSDILYGLNMQMLIYLDIVVKNGAERYGNVLPAGILYMHARKPVVSAERGESDKKIENEKNKKLRMNGLLIDEPIVLTGMEEKVNGIYIPVNLKNDGEFSKSDSLASAAQLGKLLKKVENLIIDMGKGLHKGDIAAIPKKGIYDACEWCCYHSICGYENKDSSVEVKKCNYYEVIKNLYSDGNDGVE